MRARLDEFTRDVEAAAQEMNTRVITFRSGPPET
jgi:hypothetical protein